MQPYVYRVESRVEVFLCKSRKKKRGENLLNVTTGAEPSVAAVHHIILESVFLFCLFVFIVVVVNLMESV